MTHLVPVLRPVLGTPFRRGDIYRRAGEVPSFHIAPARTRDARDLITGSVLGTYNSASPAWAVGSDGVLALPAANAPVIEYDPVTGACLGARIWGVVTNLFLRSEEFNSAPWSLNAILPFGSGSTANATLSPTGTLTADRITENSATTQHYILQTVSGVSASSTITFSVFVKFDSSSRNFGSQITDAPSGGSSYSEIYLDQSGNLTSVNPTGFTNKSASVQSYGNGWYRVSHTITTSSVTTISFRLFIVDAANNVVYAGNGGSGLFVWGAQLQTGSTLGPYVPTTTLAASSTADAWDLTSVTAGINNLKTLYFRGRTSASGTRGIASLNDNTASNRLELSTSGTTAKATAVTSGSTVSDLSGGTIAANTTFRLAVRLDTDSYALSLNGGAVTTDTSGARALVDRLFIGRDQAGNYQNGYMEEMAGWTKACTDAQVAALASS